MTEFRGDVYDEKRSGLSTEPCGTPTFRHSRSNFCRLYTIGQMGSEALEESTTTPNHNCTCTCAQLSGLWRQRQLRRESINTNAVGSPLDEPNLYQKSVGCISRVESFVGSLGGIIYTMGMQMIM